MHFEEADEDGSVLPGATKNYARSIAPDDESRSPSKERPNTSRSRKDSKKDSKRDSKAPEDLSPPPPSSLFDHSDSDSTAHSSARRAASKMKKSKEDRKSSSSKSKGTLVTRERESKRPPPRTSKTSTAIPLSRGSDDSSYYGISHQKTIASSRPRSHTRPVSYHAGSRPPLSGSAYYGHPPLGPQGFPPPPFPPQPAWGPGGPPPLAPLAIPPPPPPMHQHPPPQLPPPSPDFIRSNRELSSRFERYDQRPQTASVYHQSPLGYDPEPPRDIPRDRTVARRSSVSTRKANKDHNDRDRMPPPPPPRPRSTAPERRVLRPPPPTPRKSVNFDDDLDDESDVFHNGPSRRASVEYGSSVLPARRDSFSDDSYDDDVQIYRRESTASHRRPSSNYEDKINNASRYQNDVNGGPGAPLTAETLKRVKNDGSRGSTRSSESRDESDWKHSATTRTTRSPSVDPDDITIKLPEGAVVEVNGTRITCPGGGDVSLNNNRSRAGSDRGTSVYGDDRKSRYEDDRKSRYEDDRKYRYDDDRRSRHDRLPIRARASSQATSNPYTRSLSYAPPYPVPYPFNPAPSYAPSYYDGEDDYYP